MAITTTMSRVLFMLPLLFASSYATLPTQLYISSNPFAIFNQKHVLGPHELFGNPFGNPNDYKSNPIPDDYGTLPLSKSDQKEPPVQATAEFVVPVANTQSCGAWELVSDNSGVSAMHTILLPKTNKVLMYDATIWKISKIQLPPGHCRVVDEHTHEQDCFAHSVLYDSDTAQIKALELHTDTWCSSGGLTVDGNFVSTGGFQGGANTVRYLDVCENCNWREYPTALAEPRWYSTQATLPDGGFIVVGGRNAFSYEYIPREGQRNSKAFFFNLLKQTSDPEENNLYPFVYLSTDGNVFVFANNRSVLLNPISNQVVREFPQLPGGHRNYPPSAMAALLPIMLNSRGKEIPAEVLICGGSAHIDSYGKAGNNIFYTGLKDCGRLKITDENPEWHRDLMPAPRIMGDAVLLPTGEILMLNGAIRGTSGWGFAREPNFKPVLYNPRAVKGQRFRELAPSTIPRMYHSTSTLLPDGKVLVSGSNTNNGYIYDAMFPTELRVEKFSPPYLDFSGGKQRPTIQQAPDRISYAEKFDIQVAPLGEPLNKKEVLVTMYAPAFTTHGVSMNQRLISLVKEQVKGGSTITTVAPPSGKIAPPGYYLLFVVYKGIPSVGRWIQIL